MARAGYHPEGMARFFERIVAAEKAAVDTRIAIPPYLYTHPDVESRVEVARRRGERLTLTGTPDAEIARGMRAAQYRLALLADTGQTTLRQASAPADRSATDPLLAEAERRAGAGDRAGALAVLERAEQADPNDPRVAFRRGELLAELERTRDAIAAWRRALLLDPGVALNYFRIGLAYKSLGDRVNATFYLEQALRRFEPGGALQRRAAREIDRLTFPVITSAGVADGSTSAGADTVAGHSRDEFRSGEPRAVWWARVGARYQGRRGAIVVRWTDPGGAVVQAEAVERRRRPYVTSTLSLAGERAQRHGIWRVDALLDGDLLDRRTFRLAP
jgi:predicted Zn-dependent protease